MCGFISGQKINGWNRQKINEALTLLNHRGPDGSSFNIVNEKIMLAHARLSIVGIENGTQPLHCAGVWAVVNGEFYDYEKIRKELKQKGFEFKTTTDSEILIFLYMLYGEKCLSFLHGEFAFTLYDEKKDLWFCARDRFGIRPLNWIKEGSDLLFSSEAKAMQPFKRLELDKNNLWFSQHFQYLPQDKSIFKDINMVKPAHYLWIEKGEVKQKCYYMPNEKVTTDSMQVATEKIDILLQQAVAKRIPGEVKACTHLSGGIDSSAVSYLAAQHGIKEAFTISFTDDGFYDEVEFAQLTANKVGIHLNIVPVTFKDILHSIPKAIYHAEGFSINGHLGGKYLLNKAIHEAGFKVALSGEGSDEIFMGYSHLKQDFLSKQSLSQMEQKYLSGVQLPSGETFDLSIIEEKIGFIPTWLKAKSSMANKLSKLWSKDFVQDNPNDWFMRNMDLGAYSKLKQSSFLWSRYCLSGYILKVLDDAQAMAFSVEGRLPFLDTELVDYVWSLPDSYYFSGNIEKNILRTVMKEKLPEEIVHKTKQSFMSPPLTKALQNPAEERYIKDLLHNSHFMKNNIFNGEDISKCLEDWKLSPSPESEPILMTLLSIAALCEEYKL